MGKTTQFSSTGFGSYPYFPAGWGRGGSLLFWRKGQKNCRRSHNLLCICLPFPTFTQQVDPKGDIQHDKDTSVSLAMATASAVGGSHVLLYGGDTGHIFNQVEKAVREGNTAKRDSLWIHHTGFHNKILIYNTITDTWFEAGETVNPPVAVTSDVSDGKNVYIASGEIRPPGVRSPPSSRSFIIPHNPLSDGSTTWCLSSILEECC